jgi:Flp pilus assembly protein TadD
MSFAPKRLTSLAALLLASTMLSACAMIDGEATADPSATPDQATLQAEALDALKKQPVSDEPMSKAAYWAQRTEVEPDNVEVAVQFAKALRGIGSTERAVEFLEERLVQQPNEALLLAEYGKSLIAVGKADKALPVLMQARQMIADDWTIIVAMGVAYDQLKDYPNARQCYEAALAISPNNPSILNNLGLSYMMAGDKASASKFLLAAASAPGATAQIRANLALVSSKEPAQSANAAGDTPAEPATPASKPEAAAEPVALRGSN